MNLELIVKRPGPEHPILIEYVTGRVRAKLNGTVIADSGNALVLREANYPAIFYFPREDVDMRSLEPITRTSYCPYKGHCTYFEIAGESAQLPGLAWTYEEPYSDVAVIAGMVAFYPDRAEIIT